MQTLIEQYNEIYQKIKQLNSQIADLNEQIQAISTRRDEEIPERIGNLKAQIEKIEEYRLKIDGFIQLAEKHMISKNLSSIEAPEGYRVNLNRLRAWSMLIDPLAEDDVYAQKVYLVANCDKLFLEQKKAEFSDRIVQLDNDYNIGAPAQLKELEQKIDAVKEQIRAFLDSEVLNSFAENVKKSNEERMYSNTPDEFTEYDKDPDFLVPGAYGTAIDIIEEQREHVKLILGRYYDEKSSKIYLPLERITASEEFAMTVSCVPARRKLNEMDAGIRNLLFQIIDRSPAGSRRIYIIDAVRENTALAGGIRGLEGSAVLEPVPRNDEQIQRALESIVSGFSDIDDTIENYDTVAEYNRAVEPEKRIQRTVVVLVGWPKEFAGDNAEYAKRIFSNYERYGISFIAINISAGKDRDDNEFGFSDYVGESVISITMTMKETLIRFGQETPHSFAWYPFKFTLPSDYCKTVKSISHGKGKRVTDYSERGLLEGGLNYTRGKKLIELPYGVDGKDKLHSIVFENENFASFLMGASGSGKSTLLHSLITGIIKNYHPDDVELWLADFKMSEFSQYINPMPPHVKYILLDESKELIFDLIDRLTEKMMERQRFFMKNRELKKVEMVPSDTYMPVIFVLLDEFSIMSQAINDNDSGEYRLKLQNLLAKGRALGIKFLFSSQTFTTGLAGLTPTAKAQIQMRIAMKAAKPEIVETLELSTAQKTEQVQNWIDALPVYHALIKYRDRSESEDRIMVRRTTVLYFDDKDSPGDPYKKQRDFIVEINDRMRKISEYNPNNLYEYLDKHPIVVDGNSYDPYDESLIRERFEEYRSQNRTGADEILVSFGRPRLMTDMRITSVTQEARENFLLFAALNEQMCAASILISIAHQFAFQNCKIQIWTYARNRLFTTYETALSEVGSVVKDMAGICDSIRDIKNRVLSKTTGNELIILLGMERICGDFAFADNSDLNGAVSVGDEVAETVIAAGEVVRSLTDEEERKRQFALGWINKKREIMEKNKRKAKKTIDRLIAKAKEEYFSTENKEISDNNDEQGGGINEGSDGKAAGEGTVFGSAVENKEEVQEDREIKNESGAYNALSDLQYIVMHGSRFGYHFATYLSSYADLKSTTFRSEWFRHRLSFQMSADDSRDIFYSKIASLLPEHVCQYYDLLEGYSFRPYLNKGIDWDGWGVSESGELISPYN